MHLLCIRKQMCLYMELHGLDAVFSIFVLCLRVLHSVYILICCVYDLKALFDFEHKLNGLGAGV